MGVTREYIKYKNVSTCRHSSGLSMKETNYQATLLFVHDNLKTHGHTSELTPVTFSAWLTHPPSQTKPRISCTKGLVLQCITATLVSIYPDVNITEELKLVE